MCIILVIVYNNLGLPHDSQPPNLEKLKNPTRYSGKETCPCKSNHPNHYRVCSNQLQLGILSNPFYD